MQQEKKVRLEMLGHRVCKELLVNPAQLVSTCSLSVVDCPGDDMTDMAKDNHLSLACLIIPSIVLSLKGKANAGTILRAAFLAG